MSDIHGSQFRTQGHQCFFNILKKYCKDRLKNSVFLSPSVCTKRSILLRRETQPTLYISDAKLRSGIQDLERNKHQLLHRIASVKTPLIYNESIDLIQRYLMWGVHVKRHRNWTTTFKHTVKPELTITSA